MGGITEYAHSFKILGITFTPTMSWDAHITVSMKLSRVGGITVRHKFLLPTRTKLILYYIFFYSCLNYSFLVWGNTTVSNTVEPRLYVPGFYDGQVESRRSPRINNALNTLVIRHNLMPGPRYSTTKAMRTTDRWTKLKCRGPVPRTWSPLSSFPLRLIFRFSFLQQRPAPLSGWAAVAGALCRCTFFPPTGFRVCLSGSRAP